MIKLENVAYSYGGGEIFSGVDLSLAPGSFHFLTGPSGAGKTTLLKLCYAELAPTSGTVSLFGGESDILDRDARALLRRRIGVVAQDSEFLDHLSIAENIALPLTVAGRLSEARANLSELLAWTGLSHCADARPAELSGGERQRAALARAVIAAPDIVLADEPTGNVDWDMSERLLNLLVQLNHMGKTVVIATHDLGLIRAAKPLVQARSLRLSGGTLSAAGADL